MGGFANSTGDDGMMELLQKRQRQDSNLRGQSTMDYYSISLTTRTRCLEVLCVNVIVRTVVLMATAPVVFATHTDCGTCNNIQWSRGLMDKALVFGL